MTAELHTDEAFEHIKNEKAEADALPEDIGEADPASAATTQEMLATLETGNWDIDELLEGKPGAEEAASTVPATGVSAVTASIKKSDGLEEGFSTDEELTTFTGELPVVEARKGPYDDEEDEVPGYGAWGSYFRQQSPQEAAATGSGGAGQPPRDFPGTGGNGEGGEGDDDGNNGNSENGREEQKRPLSPKEAEAEIIRITAKGLAGVLDPDEAARRIETVRTRIVQPQPSTEAAEQPVSDAAKTPEDPKATPRDPIALDPETAEAVRLKAVTAFQQQRIGRAEMEETVAAAEKSANAWRKQQGMSPVELTPTGTLAPEQAEVAPAKGQETTPEHTFTPLPAYEALKDKTRAILAHGRGEITEAQLSDRLRMADEAARVWKELQAESPTEFKNPQGQPIDPAEVVTAREATSFLGEAMRFYGEGRLSGAQVHDIFLRVAQETIGVGIKSITPGRALEIEQKIIDRVAHGHLDRGVAQLALNDLAAMVARTQENQGE